MFFLPVLMCERLVGVSIYIRSRENAVAGVAMLSGRRSRARFPVGALDISFSYPELPDRLWGPPSLLTQAFAGA